MIIRLSKGATKLGLMVCLVFFSVFLISSSQKALAEALSITHQFGSESFTQWWTTEYQPPFDLSVDRADRYSANLTLKINCLANNSVYANSSLPNAPLNFTVTNLVNWNISRLQINNTQITVNPSLKYNTRSVPRASDFSVATAGRYSCNQTYKIYLEYNPLATWFETSMYEIRVGTNSTAIQIGNTKNDKVYTSYYNATVAGGANGASTSSGALYIYNRSGFSWTGQSLGSPGSLQYNNGGASTFSPATMNNYCNWQVNTPVIAIAACQASAAKNTSIQYNFYSGIPYFDFNLNFSLTQGGLIMSNNATSGWQWMAFNKTSLTKWQKVTTQFRQYAEYAIWSDNLNGSSRDYLIYAWNYTCANCNYFSEQLAAPYAIIGFGPPPTGTTYSLVAGTNLLMRIGFNESLYSATNKAAWNVGKAWSRMIDKNDTASSVGYNSTTCNNTMFNISMPNLWTCNVSGSDTGSWISNFSVTTPNNDTVQFFRISGLEGTQACVYNQTNATSKSPNSTTLYFCISNETGSWKYFNPSGQTMTGCGTNGTWVMNSSSGTPSCNVTGVTPSQTGGTTSKFDLYFEAENSQYFTVTNQSLPNATTPDTTPPRWSNNGTNNTNPAPLAQVLHYTNWTDNVALSHWIFSWNATGALCTGGFANDTAVAFGAGTWSNVTKQAPLACAGKIIDFLFFANDTSNNWNTTVNMFENESSAGFTVSITLSGNFTTNGIPFGLNRLPGTTNINATWNQNTSCAVANCNLTQYWLTVDSTTNTNIVVCIKEDTNLGLATGSANITNTNYHYSVSDTSTDLKPLFPASTDISTTYANTSSLTNPLSSTNTSLFYRFNLNIPIAQKAGNYYNNILIKATSMDGTC